MRALLGVRACLGARHAVEIEMAVAGLVLLAWQGIRIPLEGTVAGSLAHAASWLHVERLLAIDVEEALISLGGLPYLNELLEWAYGNIHLPAVFAFLATARLLAPGRYPFLRTTFLLSFLPAVAVIGAYPLAPPLWLPQLGLGPPPGDTDLTGTARALLENSTAAAASQHFGFALFIAASSLWLWPRSPLAWATLSYPALVFVVIVATGNHYVLDSAVGAGTFALAAGASRLIHGRIPATTDLPPTWPARWVAVAALGYAAIAWGAETLANGDNLPVGAAALALGVGCALAPRLVSSLATHPA
ncbi:MAG: hypothetical protein C4306_00235 [Thermoleophilia bacterium]